MLRSAASKAAWVGRTASMVFGLALVMALVLGIATMALAAVPGDPFKLGKVNSIDRISVLVGTATSPMLKVENKGSGTALNLKVQDGKPPMTVTSDGRVPKLNSDMVDGRHANAFLPRGGTAANSKKLEGKDSSFFAGTGMSHYAGSTSSLEGCSEKVLLSSEISPSRPALVYASGVSVYEPSGGAQGGNLQLELRDDTNTTTLASGGNMYANGGGNAVPLSAQGVLMSGSDVYTPSTPFEVTPGNSYVLRLVGNATDGCTGSTGNFGSMEYVSLSYLLIGK